MNKLFLFISLATLFFHSGLAQMNCSKYYPLTEGTTFQYTNYNKKGKTDGTSDYKVTDVKTSGENTIATMSLRSSDSKGKEIIQSTYEVTCSGKGIKIDFESLMPSSMLQQYKDMNVEVDLSGTDIELPNELSVGQSLADANVTMSVSMSGMNMKTIVNMINRKVEKQEQITTEAGSFDCLVIYSENETTIMGMTRMYPARMWLAEGVGMVQQVSYDKNKDIMSTTQLTKWSK